VDNAVLGSDGTANWLAPTYLSTGQRTCVQPLQQGLYDGLTGVGLFLAAAARVGGRVEHRELALAALSPVTRQLAVPIAARRLGRNIGLGAGNGLASLVYGLTLAATLTDEGSLLDAAAQAAGLIDPETLENDRIYDVMGGSAGAILALLTLSEATADHRWIQVARRAGERLLESSVAAKNGGRAWKTVANKLRTGFSHGAAGIALALQRLSVLTGDASMDRLVKDALEFEAAHYLSSARNWACVATEDCGPGDDQLLTSWCYGAPGIGLARLALSSYNESHDVELLLTGDLTCAVEGTQRSDFSGFDHICCGNFGRIELLWEAGRRNRNADWSNAALTRADQLLRRAERDGRWHLLEELPAETHLPGLFLGEAGIGYQLLRLADPQRVPSVLMFAL
jgi:type 2 lantibiotic biosynthesis protein LanM